MAKSIYYLYYLVEQIMSYLYKGENITAKIQGGKFLHPSPLYYGWGMSLLVRQPRDKDFYYCYRLYIRLILKPKENAVDQQWFQKGKVGSTLYNPSSSIFARCMLLNDSVLDYIHLNYSLLICLAQANANRKA